MKKEENERMVNQYEKEARQRASRLNAERRQRELLEQQSSHKMTKKPNGILKNPKSSASNTSETASHLNSDYVTLTQDQLESILTSLTKVHGSTKTDLHVKVGRSDLLKKIVQVSIVHEFQFLP